MDAESSNGLGELDSQDGEHLPVLAEVRPVQPARTVAMAPAAQAAAVAVSGFVAGAAAVAIVRRHQRAAKPARRRRKGNDFPGVVTSRSFLVDVHLLGRE